MDELTREFPYELDSDLKYIETLDHGAFGTVIHVLEISTNKEMAIKVINKTDAQLSIIQKMKEEVSILRQINHENIVQFYGYTETINQLLIKMEYIKYGTLNQWIKNHKKISEEEASIILKHILSAITYLHSKQICHRDIKPQNIMFSKENDLHSIKIIDFGLSAQNFDKLINNDYCGTYIYMAPEQIEKKLYFISVDIWSIGILMFILLNNGKHPFYVEGDNKKDFVKKIMATKINFYNKVSPMAKHLILKLLEPNSSWRYTGAQALKHPWITRNKDDEVPLTMNELLTKSNNKKIAKDLFNVCLFMNYFSKKTKKKFIINDEYIFNCKLYNEKIKYKLNKKKEKCLDIISSNEEDYDSDDSLITKKKYFPKQRKNSIPMRRRNSESLMIYSIQKEIKTAKKNVLKVNDKKIAKIENAMYRKIEERKILNSKTIKNKELASNAKYSSYKKSIGNTFRKNSYNNILLKSFYISLNKNQKNKNNIYQYNKKKRELGENIKQNIKEIIIKEKIRNVDNNKSLDNKNIYNRSFENKKSVENKSFENNKNTEKKIYKRDEMFVKIYKYNSSKKVRNGLPHIKSPQRLNYMNKQQFSLNDIENFNIVPLVLPPIGKNKKDKYMKFEASKKILKMKKK